MKFRRVFLAATGIGLLTGLSAQAFMVNVTFENLAPAGGLSLTPVFTGFHDGTWDMFNAGAMASSAVEAVAEVGMTSAIESEFQAAQVSGIFGTSAPGGPFTPGTTHTVTFALDPVANRYMSLLSMVVPSNDTFIGNDDPMAFELFDGVGQFVGGAWTFTGAMTWDSGTEVNDTMNGPAFVMGQAGSSGLSEGGSIMVQPLNGLDSFIGVTTAASYELTGALTGAPLFRVSVTAVPEPAAVAALAGLVALGLVIRRRMKA